MREIRTIYNAPCSAERPAIPAMFMARVRAPKDDRIPLEMFGNKAKRKFNPFFNLEGIERYALGSFPPRPEAQGISEQI